MNEDRKSLMVLDYCNSTVLEYQNIINSLDNAPN